jgi:lipopolysaccharide/colanic/teichoic acid biosynthesis glycosyltransferase
MKPPRVLEGVSSLAQDKNAPKSGLFADESFFEEELFGQSLKIERQRSERSRSPFILVIIDIGEIIQGQDSGLFHKVKESIVRSSRQSDIRGWHRYPDAMGIIYTEVERRSFEKTVAKLNANLLDQLGPDLWLSARITTVVFPEEDGKRWAREGYRDEMNVLYRQPLTNEKRLQFGMKDLFDRMISMCFFLALLPVFLVIATLIKLSSRGPVFFRQERIGLNCRTFRLLKFRTMRPGNDPSIHREFVTKLIRGEAVDAQANGEAMFKLTNDPRITRIGKFLRKTSLDELPQLINVMRGEMSLVGPRPPIMYEVEEYDIWHRRRLLSMKPGITGLWQVVGRSRTSFDGMVRLDILYVSTWSFWLDLKLLFKTPLVVFTGKGGA